MQNLTEEQQRVVNECYDALAKVGLEKATIGTPIPPKRP